MVGTGHRVWEQPGREQLGMLRSRSSAGQSNQSRRQRGFSQHPQHLQRPLASIREKCQPRQTLTYLLNKTKQTMIAAQMFKEGNP